MKKSRLVHNFVIWTFVALYILTSLISTIHVIDFFELSNPRWMAITLAIGFEIGAAASLASLVVLNKMNKTLIWALFIGITAMQMQGNMYYAFKNIESFEIWAQLFDIIEWEPLAQKRLMAGISGAILPLIALGFIKSLVDYIKPEVEEAANEHMTSNIDEESTPFEGTDDSDFVDIFTEAESNMPEFEYDGDEIPSFKDTDIEATLNELENDKQVEVDSIEPEVEVNKIEPEPIRKSGSNFDPKKYVNTFTKVGKDWIS